MPWLLNLAYLAAIAAAAPLLLFRCVRQGKYRRGWREKFLGDLPDLEAVEERAWFHAVSVGEVLLLRGVIAELQARRPGIDLVLTTTTTTGLEVARVQYPALTTCYCPLDFSWAVRRAIARLKPTSLILAELELWPNLVFAASETGVRLAIVNGRLSEKSFRGYRLLRPLVARLLRRFDAIAVQSDEYARRFRALGAPAELLSVTGSVKFDGAETDRGNAKTLELRRAFGVRDNESVVIAGSTQHPEEEYALATWRALLPRYPSLRLVLVPRHKERFEEVARLVEAQGLSLVRRSRVNAGCGVRSAECSQGCASTPPPVLLLDTLGELGACWGLADIAFVGGSLTTRGGQNMIEPAAYGAAVLFGPDTRNFRDAVTLLLAADAARVVRDRKDLTAAVAELLETPAVREQMGLRARAAVAAHRGATGKTVRLLAEQVLCEPAGGRRNAA